MKHMNVFIKSLGVSFGMFLAGFAMACIYFSKLGSDPITTLIDGISHTFNIGEGISTTIMNILFLTFMLVLNRQYIRGATLISVLTLGLFMDLSLGLLTRLFPADIPYIGYLCLTAAGSIILGFAIGFYLSFDFGSTPPDSVPLWIREKFKIRYQYSVWIFYTICLITGALLGGTFGIGTIIALIIVGPIADFTMRKLQI